VVGGSALLALELVARATRDVDIVAIVDGHELVSAQPLPAALVDAAHTVARVVGQFQSSSPAISVSVQT
jgi:hypothetical protein